MKDKLTGKADPVIIAVEPASCPSFTPRKIRLRFLRYRQNHAARQNVHLGASFIPLPNHAGGLRYHGMSPTLSKLYHEGIWSPRRGTNQGI
jgi:tryptophan synthase beta chain